jgi:hypothetical protein
VKSASWVLAFTYGVVHDMEDGDGDFSDKRRSTPDDLQDQPSLGLTKTDAWRPVSWRTMIDGDALGRGRRSFAQQEWADAYAQLSAAAAQVPLEPVDLEQLATASYLVGRDDDMAAFGARAHQGFLNQGSVERAIRCAFWIAFDYVNRGEAARAGGWVDRARRLLDALGHDCVEQVTC